MLNLEKGRKWAACAALPSAMLGPLHAQTEPAPPADTVQRTEPALNASMLKLCDVSRLQPHEPSYAVYQKAEGDEPALRAHYSFRYLLSPVPDADAVETEPGKPCIHPPRFEAGWYLKYTGEFDFYAGTRDSGPVINRISNPGMHYRWRQPLDGFTALRWFDLGVEHLSDGQTTEVLSPSEAARAQQAYDEDDHKFFDSVSRGMNFVSTEVRLGATEDVFGSLYAKARFYFHKDTDVTWGPWAKKDVTISDYNLLRLTWVRKIGPEAGEASITWTVGAMGLDTDSWDLDYLFSAQNRCTIYTRYHEGPLQTLSNYTQERRSIAIGLKFTP
ncbi:hypothetical protein ACLBKS_03005 [Hylemonella sp. W303a]|uniref:hypothetical protein n=1 Tax=Hylemonella sp. W303a TaxID=3389873 RepID=UPI00396B45FF